MARALGLLLLLGLLAAGLAGYLALPAAAQTPTPPANHDSDGDGLIEISTLAQLNAVRWDLDGNGAADRASNNDAYAAAFPVSADGSVCPSGVTCVGYELTADLDFDENRDGEITSADSAYWNDGYGWGPIGNISAPFSAIFEGNRHTISHLYIFHHATNMGMFRVIAADGEVRNLSLADVSVRKHSLSSDNNGRGTLVGTNRGTVSRVSATGSVQGDNHLGGLAGVNEGTITESYAAVAVSGRDYLGGLAGENKSGATISRSYSAGRVSGDDFVGGLAGYSQGVISDSYAAGTVRGDDVGGLVGSLQVSGSVKNSYSLGEVKRTAGNTDIYGGLVGYRAQGNTVIEASYYDTAVQNIGGLTAVGEGPATGASAHTSQELAAPVGYTGIYATWDDDGSDVWDFGTASQYPALKVDFDGNGTATAAEFGPYQNPRAEVVLTYRADADGDGLIEISSLAQLNAMRFDLNGNGLADDAASHDAYEAAFPAAQASAMSCIVGATCTGYELTADLDFDENGDEEITSADSAYWNNGAGWLPIGSENTPFATVFEGNRHTISHLRINRHNGGTVNNGLFAVIAAAGEVRNLGLTEVNFRGPSDRSPSGGRVGGLAGTNWGAVSRVSVTGEVSGGAEVGGLVGRNEGTISDSYAARWVNGSSNAVGGLVGRNGGTISASYAAGGVGSRGYAGGLAGGNSGTISASYAAGTVSARNNVGGLAGSNSGTISASYAARTVSSITFVDGLVSSNRGTINASYYDSDIAGAPGRSGADVKTTTMLTAPTDYTGIYANWNLDLDNADNDGDPTTGGDAPWDFGTDSQYPALKVDFDGDGEATWQEFGHQVRQPLPLTATPSHDLKALLSWPDITEPAWTKTPTVSYALYRDGAEVTDYDGSSRFYTDAGLTNRQEYTYQVALLLDGAEVRRSKAVSLTAENRPHFGQAAIDSQVYMENEAVSTLTLPQATGGDGALTYALTPDLPAGLAFDAAARTITGTPAEPQDATEYTYTAADDDGDTAELTFTIEVKPDLMPTFGLETIGAQAYTENTDIGTVTLPAATSGDGTLTYALTPDLPAGLSFDAAARAINGIPSEPQDATEYTYKVADADGDEAPLTFTITIFNNPPSFGSDSVQAQVYTENTDVGTIILPAATGGDGALSYTLTPEPPAGLSFDAAARTISGTPMAPQDATGYTYKATDGDGETAELTFTIAIANNPPSFGEEAVQAQVYTENADVGTVNLPEATGGDGTLVYTLTPEPPAGLSFDAAARAISGTPTEPQDATGYTYKVTDGDGETAELTFTIEVEEDLEPTFGEEAIDSQVYTQSRDIGRVNLPEATGGDGTPSYTLTPGLPAGLNFDPAARTISGTPTEPRGETEYTYTVADADGDEATLTFTIEVEADLTPPTLTPVELVMSPTNDNTPSVVFISSEPGTLVFGGDCGNPAPSEIVTADTETRLTYPQLADGAYSGCSVAITDAAGNTGYPAVHPSFWDIVVDTQAPTLESAVVAHPFGDIVLRFSEEISWFHQPDAGAFQVFVDGEQAEVQFIAIGWPGNGHDQREVLLELSLSTPEGAEVVVNYHHVDTLSPLQDHAGNQFPSGRYEVGQ